MKLPAALLTRTLIWSAHQIAHRPPDFVIGDDYLRRWYVMRDGRPWTPERARVEAAMIAMGLEIERRGLNVYVHVVRKSDDDRALHDHPWSCCSIVLAGSYLERVPADPREPAGPSVAHRRTAGDIIWRPAGSPHRLEIDDGPAMTLFLTGPRVREWGFHCRRGWRHWREFTAAGDSGQVGRGCGGLE